MLPQKLYINTKQKYKCLNCEKPSSRRTTPLHKKRAGGRNHLRCVINVTHEKIYKKKF